MRLVVSRMILQIESSGLIAWGKRIAGSRGRDVASPQVVSRHRPEIIVSHHHHHHGDDIPITIISGSSSIIIILILLWQRRLFTDNSPSSPLVLLDPQNLPVSWWSTKTSDIRQTTTLNQSRTKKIILKTNNLMGGTLARQRMQRRGNRFWKCFCFSHFSRQLFHCRWWNTVVGHFTEKLHLDNRHLDRPYKALSTNHLNISDCWNVTF